MRKLNVDDKVIVNAGKDKGKSGKILKLFWGQNKVLVEGVNLSTKALKPSQENPNGGFVQIEKALPISNVALVSPKSGKATKVGIKTKDGKKVRFAKSCGTEL
jgi:large subunit ribosomal protein L24